MPRYHTNVLLVPVFTVPYTLLSMVICDVTKRFAEIKQFSYTIFCQTIEWSLLDPLLLAEAIHARSNLAGDSHDKIHNV